MRAVGIRNPLFIASVILAVAIIAAFSLACFISTHTESADESAGGLLQMILGSAASAVGDELYEMADRYFHRGVGHVQHVQTDDIFLRVSRRVTPEDHTHLSEGREMLEIMPWLRFATKVDPGNIEAYSVALHWLLREGLIGEAREVLREAIENNPSDYRVYLEGGLFYLRSSDTSLAARYLDRSFHYWPLPLAGDSEEAIFDLGAMLSYRAFVHQLAGEYARAAEMLRRELSLFPRRTGLADTIAKLESGQPDYEQLGRMRALISRSSFDHDHCDDGEHHHH